MRQKLTTTERHQLPLLTDHAVFPSTRFQGSKLKIVEWIWDAVRNLEFHTVLDAFGGTGSVGYMFKSKDKCVTYNDALKFNWLIGSALIENSETRLTDADIAFVLTRHRDVNYGTFVYDTFKDVYFTDEENAWIDTAVANIMALPDFYKRALAWFALFQACIIKRPFNLFHRKNLYLRFSDVERNFGNKTTWDTPFDVHFRQFAGEANSAVFDNGWPNIATNRDAMDVEGEFDLVYIDTPYISRTGTSVDYLGFYHFLEGLVHYDTWASMINYRTKHRRLKARPCVWTDRNRIATAFDDLLARFQNSIIVVSYRSDGIPSVRELLGLLKRHKAEVQEIKRKNYKYVLSNNHSEEVLLIGR